MKKFDLKKAILENKATFHSSLNEGYDEFKRADKGSKDVTAKDKGEEEVYGAGVKKGEEIEKKKLKPTTKMKENDDIDAAMDFEFQRRQKEKQDKLKAASDLGIKNKENNDIDAAMDFEFQRRQKEKQDKLKAASNSNIDTRDIYDLGIKNKMKVSELKAKIKEMIVAEYEKDVDVTDENPEKEVDFLAELEEMLNEGSPMNDPRTKQVIQMLIDMDVDGETMEYILRQVGMDDQMSNQLVNYPAEYAASLNEADETEKDTAEVDTTDVTVDDTETTDVETTAEVDPNVKAVQDSLTQAQAAAQALGDKKLIDQIGNTITFFTRAHVVEKPKGAVTEADEIELSNMQYVLDWWEELPFEKKKEIFHKEHEAEDDINRFRMNESMFPMLNKILK